MKNILISTCIAFALTLGATAQNTINSYEYWFDNDFSDRVMTPVSPVAQLTVNTNIPTSGLTDGIHTFNFRTLDSEGLSSSVLSEYFYKVPAQITATNKEMLAYEYWFDNDFANAVSVNTAQQQQINISELLTTTGLNNGVHTFNIRFKDNAGLWSSVLSEYFYKVPETVTAANPEIMVYEYWFDNDYSNAQTVSTAAQQQIVLSDLIPTSGLNNGIHTFNIRFKDNGNLWSSVLSEYFYKVPETVTAANPEIMVYEYWFDNDYSNAQTVSTAAQQQIVLSDLIPTSGLNNGIHTFNIRFKDNTDLWSSVLSEYFYKVPQQTIVNNLITEYRYWLDQDFQNAIYTAVNPAVQQLQLLENLDFTMIPKDEYIISFQFKDTTGLWSSVISDTIVKNPLPIPIFAADSTMFCDAGTVQFINNSIDGDEYLWDFGDGNTSTDASPIHSYLQPGTYNVSLTVYDLITPIDSTVVENELVIVYALPDASISLSGNDSICVNEEVTLSAVGSGVYDWSTGENTSTITVNETGDYSLTVIHPDFAACYSESDTITITVMPLPYAGFAYTFDSLAVTFSNLSEDGESYYWDFGDGNSSSDFSPLHNYATSANYEVMLVTSNWCGSDTAALTVELEFLSVTNHSQKELELSLFPNPTSKDATIQLSSPQENIEIRIYNSLGALVHAEKQQFTDQILLNMDYQQGTYLIHIFTEDFEGVLRLVKQ